MRNEQCLLFSFMKSCLPCEEVTNFPFHTKKGMERQNRRRRRVFCFKTERKVSPAQTGRNTPYIFRGKVKLETFESTNKI